MGTVWARSMICTLLRVPKMYSAIFGFQRWAWWPKWTPASSSWRIEKSGSVIGVVSGLSLRGHVSSSTHRRVGGTTGMAYRALVRVWNGALIATRLRQGKQTRVPASRRRERHAALNRLDV